MSDHLEMPCPLTVIVPTFNRLPILRLCLQSLEQQTSNDFEVIIVDDGSTDDTASSLPEIRQKSPLRIRVLHQENAGPARGRNLAIAHVTTPLCLLIGDDILGSHTFVQAHLDFHKAQPDREAVGLGRTSWDRVHQAITPYMEWYENLQFDYGKLDAGLPPTWHNFYTSNLSFKTGLLRDNPFDERFRAAAWEDNELGYRLTVKNELRLTYLPNALATHVHPTTLMQAIKRMRTIGRAEHLFYEIWPAARNPAPLTIKDRICFLLRAHPALMNLLTAAFSRLEGRIKPNRLHYFLLRIHQQLGYLEAVSSSPSRTQNL